MNYNIPSSIYEKIILDSIILLKHKTGWNKIHNIINNKQLYLKKKNFIYNHNFYFLTIKRLNEKLYINENIYIWFKKYNNNYVYDPKNLFYNINDVFSMDEYGNYLDDYIDDYFDY